MKRTLETDALLTWLAGFSFVVISHAAWLMLDRRPPVWDMAFHQRMGLLALEKWFAGILPWGLPGLSDYYPPLYYLQEALVIRTFGDGSLLPLISNLTGLFLLSYCTFRLASRALDPMAGAAAGVLVLTFPMTAWLGRESLLDVPLAGWVALSLLVVHRSRDLEHKPSVLYLGLCGAAGFLTKWTYGLFLAPALLRALYRSGNRRRAVVNLMDAALLMLPPLLWWYLPNLQALVRRFQLTAQAAMAERDPSALSLLGLVYYPRCLASYYLFLPLTIAFILGIVLRRRTLNELEQLCWTVLIGGIGLLTLVSTKDPRYVLPLAAPLAVLLVGLWVRHRRWIAVLAGVGCFQFLLVSFPSPLGNMKLAAFAVENDTDYLGMGTEWVLFETDYFGVTGPPSAENWRLEEILAHLKSDDRIGFVPDAPFFHPGALELAALRAGIRVEVSRVGMAVPDPETMRGFDWVVGKTGAQGISYITLHNPAVYSFLENETWMLINAWGLPDESQARLWRNPTRSP